MSGTTRVNGASSIRRTRSTKKEIEQFRSDLYEIVEREQPCSVRQVYYDGIGRLWGKDQGGRLSPAPLKLKWRPSA